jgi:hypothetical protein
VSSPPLLLLLLFPFALPFVADNFKNKQHSPKRKFLRQFLLSVPFLSKESSPRRSLTRSSLENLLSCHLLLVVFLLLIPTATRVCRWLEAVAAAVSLLLAVLGIFSDPERVPGGLKGNDATLIRVWLSQRANHHLFHSVSMFSTSLAFLTRSHSQLTQDQTPIDTSLKSLSAGIGLTNQPLGNRQSRFCYDSGKILPEVRLCGESCRAEGDFLHNRSTVEGSSFRYPNPERSTKPRRTSNKDDGSRI